MTHSSCNNPGGYGDELEARAANESLVTANDLQLTNDDLRSALAMARAEIARVKLESAVMREAVKPLYLTSKNVRDNLTAKCVSLGQAEWTMEVATRMLTEALSTAREKGLLP